MTDFIKFDVAQKRLDAAVTQVDAELVGAADIREALYVLASYRNDLALLPAAYSRLLTERCQIENRRPRRAAAVRTAAYAVAMIEAEIKGLQKSLKHNIEALQSVGHETPPARPIELPGLKLPATRAERVEQLKAEIAEAERKLAEASLALKKARALDRSDESRGRNIDRKMDETGRELENLIGRASEMAKLANKTAGHLRNRQDCRVRKAATRLPKTTGDATASIQGFENADGSPIEFADVRLEPLPKSGPSDEELRRKAEEFFGQSVSDEQLAELRTDPEFSGI